MRQMLKLPRDAVKAIAGAVVVELADLKHARNVKRLFNHPMPIGCASGTIECSSTSQSRCGSSPSKK